MPRDGSLTRERILDAAERLVVERGFAATSVDAVIEAARTTKGGFFHHFPSKRELGRALIARYTAGDLALLAQLASEAEAASGDPAEQLVALIDGFTEAADAHAREAPGCLYVSFVHEGEELLFEDSLSTLEHRLAKLGFCRVHRSELVNLHCVVRLRTQSPELELDDGQTVPVSRRLLPQVKRRLGLV